MDFLKPGSFLKAIAAVLLGDFSTAFIVESVKRKKMIVHGIRLQQQKKMLNFYIFHPKIGDGPLKEAWH